MARKEKNDNAGADMRNWFKEVVRKIRTEEDPVELNEYRRLFRKNVPLTIRSYFAAYLLKEMENGTLSSSSFSGKRDRFARTERSSRTDSRSSRRNERAEERKNRKSGELRSRDHQKTENRPVLADDVSTTLFMSIGRNRRVFPRDIIGLIMQNMEIDRDHIGDIRVLDNYSFVQVITEDAERIIAALNNLEYRGRQLVVSYSRKKEESPTDDAGRDTGRESVSAETSSETGAADYEEQQSDIQ